MEKTFELLPPTMPNFVRFKKEPRPMQEGFNANDQGFDIANFTKEEAEQYAELMYKTFMEHWEDRKAKK